MPVTTPVMLASSNRRRGWVIASEDDDSPKQTRPSSFDARSSVAAWNRGNGPSQASIPSRASSLAPTSPDIISSPAGSSAAQSKQQHSPPPTLAPQLPPPRQASSTTSQHTQQSVDNSDMAFVGTSSTSQRRRPSPPLLVPPKQSYRRAPSARVLPPSAYSDHKRMMAAADSVRRPTAPTRSPASLQNPLKQPRTLLQQLGARSSHHAQQSSGSSSAGRSAASSSTNSSVAQNTGSEHRTSSATSSVSTPASSVVSAVTTHSDSKKGKERAQDVQIGPKSMSVSSQEAAEGGTPDRRSPAAMTDDDQADPTGSTGSRRNNRSILLAIKPMPPVSERSSTPDSVASSATENEYSSNHRTGQRVKPADLRIEIPPRSVELRSSYPAIMIDSTHVDDDADGVRKLVVPRRRRSSSSGRNSSNGEDDDDGEDDDSSWPSTPSTTPLEVYFSNADVQKARRKNVHQTTREIIAADANTLGMGRPMVVVTSPSTASEVSSDRRSSSGSGTASDAGSNATGPPSTTAPALPTLQEVPTSVEDPTAQTGFGRRSLSFELPPALPRKQSNEGGPTSPKQPSKAFAFFTKISSGKASNRNSVDVVPTTPGPRKTSVEDKRTSVDQRRSVELKPILLNAAVNVTGNTAPSNSSSASPRASTEDLPLKQQRRSSVRMPVRPNVVPYHSRRSSDFSNNSSSASLGLAGRGSMDRDAFDPKFSPSSQVSTTITVPSPALKTEQKIFAAGRNDGSAERSGAKAGSGPTNNSFAASTPNLNRRSGEEGYGWNRKSQAQPVSVHQLVESQKGRMIKDHDTIAEWISVSMNDVPAPNDTHPYGNGGAGEYSNQKPDGGAKSAGKRLSRSKPWKLGRFAASEVVLPLQTSASHVSVLASASATKLAPQPARRSSSAMRRSPSSSARVTGSQIGLNALDSASKSTAGAPSAPEKSASFVPNLGFTTANRNAALQSLCAERSIAALAAASINVASTGRIRVPSKAVLQEYRERIEQQQKAEKKSRKTAQESKNAAIIVPTLADVPSAVAELEQKPEGHLNLPSNRHSTYDVQGKMATIKSMIPETGEWCDPLEPVEIPTAPQPFRDYEDEGSDLFDSSSDSESESESENEMDQEDELCEVPVRYGHRSHEPDTMDVFFSSLGLSNGHRDTRRDGVTSASHLTSKAPVIRSASLANMSPGSMIRRGKEIRLCVDERPGARRKPTASVTSTQGKAIWKAVKVADLDKSTCDDGGYLELRRQRLARIQQRQQRATKAMKLEQEVSKGAFAFFVGNGSPIRQAKRSSVDLAHPKELSERERGSPTKVGKHPSSDRLDDELFICKEDRTSYVVRWAGPKSSDKEDILEIVRRSSTGSWMAPNHFARDTSIQYSLDEQSLPELHHLPGTPIFNLNKAFPSPFLASDKSNQAEQTLERSRKQGSQATNGSSMASEDGESRQIGLRIHRQEGQSGFEAFFEALDGREWFWQARVAWVEPGTEASTTVEEGPNGIDMHLYMRRGTETVELASYSTESELRNAFGLFKSRGKSTAKGEVDEKPIPAPPSPAPMQVMPLGTRLVGSNAYGPAAQRGDIPPRRGIRGGSLLKQQHSSGGIVAGNVAWKHRLWQNQRAAMSTDSVVVQVNNHAVNNARSSLQMDGAAHRGAKVREAGSAISAPSSPLQDAAAPSTTNNGKRMGEVHFTLNCYDHDLAVVTLLALLGTVKLEPASTA